MILYQFFGKWYDSISNKKWYVQCLYLNCSRVWNLDFFSHTGQFKPVFEPWIDFIWVIKVEIPSIIESSMGHCLQVQSCRSAQPVKKPFFRPRFGTSYLLKWRHKWILNWIRPLKTFPHSKKKKKIGKN
jgi:hypothetical protein